MGRLRGSGRLGPVRSLRLPRALDAWLEERLGMRPERSVSDLLVALVHGGLRLREGYMTVHRLALERFAYEGDPGAEAVYRACLLDTFGAPYVEHLDRWIEAERSADIDPALTSGA